MDERPARAGQRPSNAVIGAFEVRRPEHVVYREFESETIVLNLETGRYHGLNGTAGRMLEALEDVGEPRLAAERVALEHGLPADEVERDLRELCAQLAERGLIHLHERGEH